jgi:outer membrane receptor protein involved in Fe transport
MTVPTRFIAPWFLLVALVGMFPFALAPPGTAEAQGGRGRLTGKVLARETGEPMSFADVMLIPADPAGKRSGGQTNADGTFTLEADPGVYVLQVRSISYRTKQVTGVTVVAGKTDRLDVALDSEALEQDEVVVEARAVTNTEGALLNARKKAAAVGDAVSAEQVRRSPDRDVADVLKRVTGASVVDNKFVYVRGLGERYSSTSIDGVRVTSPEPAKRVVPLDLIPANLLDNVVVQKTYTADRPGEFGGGDVQVQTKAFPGQRVYGFSLSQAWSEETTFRNGFMTYDGASGDAWGFGSSGREAPDLVRNWAADRKAQLSFDPANGFRGDSVETMGRSFRNVWSPRSTTPGPNGAAQLNFGDELQVAGRALGVVGSLSWSRNRSYDDEGQFFYENGADQDTAASYAIERSNESVLFGGTGGVSYRVAPAHTVHLRGTYTNSADDEVRFYTGYLKSQGQDYAVTRLRYVQRQIRSGSLGAEHDFPSLARARVTWRASLSAAERSEPDRREYTYTARRDVDGNPAPDLGFSGGGREFGRLDDDGRGFDLKVGLPLGRDRWSTSKVEIGGSLQERDRLSTYRRFAFYTTGSYGTATPPESIYAGGQWGDPGFGAQMTEGTLPEDCYEAGQKVWAGYVSGDLTITRRLRAIAGLRVEDGRQTVRTFDYFTGETPRDASSGRPQMADLSNTDFLPSVNLIYQLGDLTNLRLAAAHTLSRPDIRELNPGTTQDFIGGFRFRGNPDLVRATIWNYDLRAEIFPSIGEVLAFSVFYKQFTDPIEYAILPSDQPLIAPVNSESGRNMGLELETRFDLARATRRLRGLAFNLNASIIDSEIDLESGLGSHKHPLQGQSDYLVNAGLNWAPDGSKWDGSLFVNRVGRRLINLGYPPNGDIYDDPSTLVDASVQWRPADRWRLKLAGGNLFDASYVSRQNDKIWRFSKPGRTISLSASFGS